MATPNLVTPKRDIRLLIATVLGICLIFAMTYASRLARQAAVNTEVAQWEAKIVQSTERQHALNAELRYIQSDAYVDQLAHDELGMVKPDEELVVIVPAAQPEAEHSPVVAASETTQPFWQGWLNRLGLTAGAGE